MITKPQLKAQFSRYKLQVEQMPTKSGITKYKISLLSNQNKLVAKCTLCRHRLEYTWNIGDTKSYIKGVGKLIYYCAMDFVYPDYVAADMCGSSNSAIRVWQALSKTDYVESVFDSVPHWELDEEENDNYSSIRCRFKW